MFALRRAFTLVELLVVIAIIAILVMLLMPAINAVREAARMNACKNHARQTGVALHGFHSARRHLPAGWIVDESDHHDGEDHGHEEDEHHEHAGDPGWGWAAMILPFVEEEVLYRDVLHRKLPITASENSMARKTTVSVFRCPSDWEEDLFMLHEGEEHHDEEGEDHDHEERAEEAHHDEQGPPMFRVARANFAGIFGSHDALETPDDADGLFYENSRVRFRDIGDGLSKTFLVGERSSRSGGTTWVGRVPGASHAMSRVVGFSYSPPNSSENDLHDFSSHHPTGAHFVMADGSVRLVDDEIDMEIYEALFTRSGYEPVPQPD